MKKKQKAFTMIEVLVAMLVLAIGLLGLAAMTVVVLRSNVLSQQISEATTITGDLMESLKLRSISELTDCDSTTAGNVISVTGPCPIINESGLSALTSDYYPLDPSNSCEIDGVLSDFSDDTAGAFDSVTANLISFPASASEEFCTQFDDLPKGRYVRFYRSFDPDPADGRDERRLIVVVLWKDRFGKWRNLNLETTRAN